MSNISVNAGHGGLALEGAELAKLEALRRTKLLATGALVLCVLVLLAARALQSTWPVFAYVAAFAEAADEIAFVFKNALVWIFTEQPLDREPGGDFEPHQRAEV